MGSGTVSSQTLFEQLSMSSSLDSFPSGPRVAYEGYLEMKRRGLTSITHHTSWRTQSGVLPGDRSIHEHQTLSDIEAAMLCVDQLNAANLHCAELGYAAQAGH